MFMHYLSSFTLITLLGLSACSGVFRANDKEVYDSGEDTETEALDTACDDCVEICDDGIDNDKDKLVDCADLDCIGDPSCREICDDGLDNDEDGRVDCEDSDCDGDSACVEICNDGIDNDGDGLIDCEDGDCISSGLCTEDCNDGIDNDGDGLIDCADDECFGPDCHTSGVDAWVTGGSMVLQDRIDYTYRFSSVCGPVQWGAHHRGSGTALAVTGKVRATPKGATGPVECNWQVERAKFAQNSTVVSFPTYSVSVYIQPVNRTGVSVEPGCGISPTATWFLPAQLRPFRGSVPDASSHIWYSGARTGGFSSSSFGFDFSCLSYYTWFNSEGSFNLSRADSRYTRYP